MSIRKSLLKALLDRYVTLAVNLGSMVVLARLLTPSEVGAFSVAMVLISVMSMMRQMGAGQYLVQEKELTEDRIRAVWAVQLGVGLLLAAVVAGMAVPAGHLYGDVRIRDILLVLAVNFVVTPFGSVTASWLTRQMRFGALAVINFAYVAANALVSIVLAWHGHGAISLAWGNLAGTVANALVAACFRPENYPWLPGLREVRRVLAFGARISSSSLAETLARGAPDFLLGKLQDLAAAGFFSRANGLVAMFHRLVFDVATSVAASGFAKQSREAGNVRASFLVNMAHITALCWAFTGVVIVLAPMLIRLLYGPQWEASIELVRWLGGAFLFSAPAALCTAALTGLGEARLVLRASLFSTVVAMPLFIVGALLGLQAMAVAVLVASMLATGAWLRITREVLRFSWAELGTQCARSALVMLATVAGPALVVLRYGTDSEHTLTVLALGGAGAAAGFLAGLFAAGHPLLSELRRLVGHRRLLGGLRS
jgi:O-antigen/teichoic acid export membrane protein